jgi:hypothetical protein
VHRERGARGGFEVEEASVATAVIDEIVDGAEVATAGSFQEVTMLRIAERVDAVGAVRLTLVDLS